MFDNGLFDPAAYQIELAFGFGGIHFDRHRKHDLFNFRTRRNGLCAKRLDIYRHLSPAIDAVPNSQNFLLDNTAAAFLRAQIGTRQKHHANRQPATIIIMAGARDVFDKKVAWNFNMDTSTIASHAISIDRTAMPDRLQRLDG
jgi:hypothetical protein